MGGLAFSSGEDDVDDQQSVADATEKSVKNYSPFKQVQQNEGQSKQTELKKSGSPEHFLAFDPKQRASRTMTAKQPNKYNKGKPTLDAFQDTSSSLLIDLSGNESGLLQDSKRYQQY